jgi:hypothetical protein
MSSRFEVEVAEQPDGPDAELRARFRVCAERRLTKLEAQGRAYPAVGDVFDILDAFEGPYVWEMTPEELAARPPVGVELEVTAVDPIEPVAEPAPVRVVVRVVA